MPRVAVVGSGISGLSAAWLLQKSGTEVVLFEKEGCCGGHTLTDDSPGYPVDLGFQVYNLTTYPNLVGLLDELKVDTEPSEMSFAFSDQGSSRLEWASHGLGTVFAQWRNCFSPSFLLMVYDVVRFGRQAPKVLGCAKYRHMSVGTYLRAHKYSTGFIQDYFLPMCAAVWSVPNSQVMGFPVEMLVRFWVNHHLLDLVQRPVWRVVAGRSRSYVDAILAELPDVRTGTGVTRVVPRPEGSHAAAGADAAKVQVETASGEVLAFDAVVLATHADTSLQLLQGSGLESIKELLAAVPYRANDIWLHTDASLMPRDHALWASWNFIRPPHAPDDSAVCVSYWTNRLQRLPADAPDTFVTLNPVQPPAEGKVIRRLSLSHPVYSAESYTAQQRLASVQGKGGIHLAGAWCGYGFHEDGLSAGMAAAEALGARIPWTPRAACPKISLTDRFFMRVFDGFARAALKIGRLRIILPNGEELVYGPPKLPAGAPQATMRLFSCAFFRKVVTRHDTGMGESYMDANYEVDDLGQLLALATANAHQIQASRGGLGVLNWVGDRLLLLAHLARSNTLGRSVSNIEAHYDIGNDVYRLFLDPSLTYSSGIHMPGDSLEKAQERKLDALIAAAGISEGDHVLEIGCGWGSMAIRAVQTKGCRWTGITISKAQLEEAMHRVGAAGLEDSIQLLFCDYRECKGTFDAVVSCEMIEAVGQEHLWSYFQAIGRLLKPGGKAAIQAISEPDERYEAYCRSSDFIREHVFPGGHLPCMNAMVEAARGTGLRVTNCVDIGPHYATTLRAWRAAWEQRREELLALRMTDRFWRKFRFYFAYCEAAFDARYIHNFQISWEKAADVGTAGAGRVESSVDASASSGLPLSAKDPTDPVTQVLLAVYSFLAGVAVTKRRLWLMPMASASFAVLALLVAALSRLLLPRYRHLNGKLQVRFCALVVHLGYSGLACLAAACLVVAQPQMLSLHWKGQQGSGLGPERLTVGPLADALVCISAGFFAFQLWALVHRRLGGSVAWQLTDYTLRLGLYSAAAYKALFTPLLAAVLLSELSTALRLCSDIQDLLGGRRPSAAWRRATLAAAVLCQLVPHVVMTVGALCNGAVFAAMTHYIVACAAGIYTCTRDLLAVKHALRGCLSSKSHAA
ncbi:hypothetical protein WJX73_004574 [Symbiochloris irregularis]|uniref:Cyclopropane-fatty-acyl-phospholipid synthase n=1 Tax=Symbiochloris irregularis TaxID=706552 RepID=A0AAW1P508_9CHLO